VTGPYTGQLGRYPDMETYWQLNGLEWAPGLVTRARRFHYV